MTTLTTGTEVLEDSVEKILTVNVFVLNKSM